MLMREQLRFNDLQPMALYRSEVVKKKLFRTVETVFWSVVNCAAWYGIFYTISEMPLPGLR